MLAVTLAGCGKRTTVQGGNDVFSATTLTVYSDLPFQGSDSAVQTAIINGERLALYQAGGHVSFPIKHGRPGNLHVSFDSLNDAIQAAPGLWTAQATANSAKIASQDQSAVAYVGDFDSGATAVSLPLNNQNDILQIAIGSPYAGFTDAAPGVPSTDPASYYPFKQRTLARLVPSDVQQATAMVSYMRTLGVRRVYWLADTTDPRNADIGPLVARDAAAAGIAVVGHASLSTAATTPSSAYAAVARGAAAATPDAVLFGGAPGPGAQALWAQLHRALPRAKLFVPSALAVPAFLVGLGRAAASTYVTSPFLERDQYPASAKAVFVAYRSLFGSTPSVYALYGYEAMRDVLAAVRVAGRNAPDRSKLLAAFFGLGTIHGVIGTYRIDADGDTTLDRFDGYRVGAGGALVLVRPIS